MLILTVKLLIAHIIGDFVFQPDSWVEDKKINKHKSKFLYIHGLVHLIALIILVQFNWPYWPYLITIVISHLIIDLIKLNLEGIINNRILFIIDQISHIIIISIVVYLITPYTIDLEKIYSKESLLFILALLSITFVSSIIMKMIMTKWNLEEDSSDDSLQNAGKYIGILERLFVFGFIILNQWGAIGLLIAAKSVFRFGDLSRAKNRKLTEYMLIGSLISFGLAILIGLSYRYFIS
ncbi:MAG: DUF3307 domain-containing protein [Lutibacter sp.]|uniref:DUF3307 domain-containing protein n=1 Tax=Lutibacter sp. TaxID=1925666 RepID=UPI00299E95BC|nr:DUF3307 domain-containing protein [Lutibacter sp.]MDX1829276.1 DUF3307 domain-containing protein [Lutibacter sp.]